MVAVPTEHRRVFFQITPISPALLEESADQPASSGRHGDIRCRKIVEFTSSPVLIQAIVGCERVVTVAANAEMKLFC